MGAMGIFSIVKRGYSGVYGAIFKISIVHGLWGPSLREDFHFCRL